MGFYNWDMLPVTQEGPGLNYRRLFGDHIQLQHLIAEPGGTPPELHQHEGVEEFFYIQAGEWEFVLGKETRKVGPGDVIHVPPGETHTIRLTGYEPGMVLEISHPILHPEMAKDRELFTIDAIRDRMEFAEEPDEMNRGRPPEKG